MLVIDRTELTYQLQRRSSHVEGAALLDVLSNDRFDVSLASLIAARAADGAQPAEPASGSLAGAAPDPHARPPKTA